MALGGRMAEAGREGSALVAIRGGARSYRRGGGRLPWAGACRAALGEVEGGVALPSRV